MGTTMHCALRLHVSRAAARSARSLGPDALAQMSTHTRCQVSWAPGPEATHFALAGAGELRLFRTTHFAPSANFGEAQAQHQAWSAATARFHQPTEAHEVRTPAHLFAESDVSVRSTPYLTRGVPVAGGA